uniref:sugar ABC transporter ATP-binding protein n=1 Tax=Pseudaquabacterium pictum TaxID=2315236 RepID=UPI001D1387F7|nr:sugar ABC transporter ATP-binding protein [Rubrivivax pictus]
MSLTVHVDAGSAPVLELRGIDKRFPGVAALQDAALRLRAGEVHALMGQNGAGKSTLIKALTGVHPPDAGQTLLQGRPIAPATPLAAQRLGIATVYQEINLCPNLSASENILAGRLPRRWGWIDWARAHAQARETLAGLQVQADVRRPLGELPVAVQQMVAIARAVSQQAQVLILDEPTSSLDDAETAQLFTVLRRLRGQGVAILFVTHFLDQVYALADRITVMRNGRTVGEYLTTELPRLRLVSLMVGREFSHDSAGQAPLPSRDDAAPALAARGLAQRGQMQPFDLTLRRGEVLGLAGLLGSGRTETARLLFGAQRSDQGQLLVDGQPCQLRHPADAVRRHLAFCPEERKTEGIVAELSVRENIVLALQAQRGWRHFIPRAEQVALATRLIQELGIKTADAEVPIGQLSGGNQQKAVLARWLATAPRVLILDEPTRGIDIAAKQEIMDQVLQLCRRGMALVFISSEIPEVLRVSHRVAVLRERRIVAERHAAGLSEGEVMAIITEAPAGAAPIAVSGAAA